MSDHLADLRRDFNHARDALHTAVVAACPGLHHSVQHRDRKPPWCRACGRDDLGRQQDRTAEGVPERDGPCCPDWREHRDPPPPNLSTSEGDTDE